MNNNSRQFIKLGVWGTGLPLLFVSIVLTLTFLFIETNVCAQDLRKIQPTAQPVIPSPLLKTCASYGYTCASGYTCTLDTRSLGVPNSNVRNWSPVYACSKSSITYKDGCMEGWENMASNINGEYTCKPRQPMCKTPETFPYPAPGYAQYGGYFCLNRVPSPERY